MTVKEWKRTIACEEGKRKARRQGREKAATILRAEGKETGDEGHGWIKEVSKYDFPTNKRRATWN
ncbi:hypothetical protein HJFPF1_01026 [Paramyrothecium foliicola]|nr:hypothetical protein HJFPF1_01026 [Paramyrothecium foliicola]